jgi:cytochrome c2
VGGRWDEARMDAFLRDPNAFAPGSRMSQGRVDDPVERRAIIEFLKNYR